MRTQTSLGDKYAKLHKTRALAAAKQATPSKKLCQIWEPKQKILSTTEECDVNNYSCLLEQRCFLSKEGEGALCVLVSLQKLKTMNTACL
ncbi:hypothetical protein HMPREF9240_01768 [Winkia neuii BV029A5]|uniref:Uncharacterized protein n=1 Tax=Winkia neuii BV029A5 TaxID=888439 RepID=K0YP68_9ACTO|nr:hypothetical protein HMPREF9240_01768 [Winkia neuii BV029A5]